MSDYSFPDTSSGPRLVSYERHGKSNAELSNRYAVYDGPPHDSRTQRSYSFQKRSEMTEVSDRAPRELPNSLLRYYDDECGGHTVSYDGMCFYDPVQETDILDDDASEEASEIYEPGTYNGADVGTSSSGEEDDPELRELEERDNIVLKYEKGPESKDIDPWENPEFDVYAKMDRFGFVHKNSSEAAEEERASRRRIAKEVKRENKWLAMDQAWKKNRLPKKLEERTWKGIPEKLRMRVWPRLLGAYELKEVRPNLFQEILKRALLVSKDIKQIDLDINRTYRDHMAFRRRYDVKQQSLMNVLAAYAMYNTEVGYCQGMSQIAALFLMYLDEEDTFWCMHALMVGKKHTMHGFFVPGFPKLSRFEAHFKKILKKYKPRVYKHLEKSDIPYIYLTKWWFGCFLDRVPFSLALRLWDVYILEGDPILLAMALNIMKMHEKSIRKLQMENFMDFIQTTLASDFGYSDDETMFSLREVLSKLKSDGLHILPPPGADDLPEVPTKALGPILARPVSSIREEQEEIKSRRSHAASIGRSPHPRRSKKIIHLRTPSAPSSRRPTSDDACSSLTSVHDSRKLAPSGEDIPFDNPCQMASLSLRHVPPPDPLQNPPATDSGLSHKPLAYSDGFMLNQSTLHLRKSTMRDEHTGRMVTVVRSDDDDLDDSRRSHDEPAGVDKNRRNLRGQTDRVLHTHNNVTIITLGDDSVV
ncbi:Rab-GAP TBC domain-containing protein [Trichostrongylus colubriformis]|uniref:Rab-GAP TBC domain-containing protein n=1 Tax=Trichostrongylus colubriformis TaxID=6319 RepID=A0AAN8J2T2_TRICO